MATPKAIDLVRAYKQKKEAPKPNPVIGIIKQLVPLLTKIAERKETPVEITNEIIPSDVKVEAPIVNFPDIVIPELPKMPDIKFPDVVDYGKAFTDLKESVDALRIAVENRPTEWIVKRNNKGFIEEVSGKE